MLIEDNIKILTYDVSPTISEKAEEDNEAEEEEAE